MKKTETILQEVKINKVITEAEISLLKCRSNKLNFDVWDYDVEDIKVEHSQMLKGLDWLKNLYQSPKGKERKNNPFGYREIDVLTSHPANITAYFKGYYDLSNYGGCKNYSPIYEYCNNTGASFEYYVKGGECIIIG